MPRFLTELLAIHTVGKDPYSLVFATRNGCHLRGPNFRRSMWTRALRRGELPDPQPTIHDLRHTAASLFRAAGYDVKQMQRALGHKTSAVTLDTYTHLFEGHDDESLDRLDSLHQSARATPGATPESAQVLHFRRTSP